MERPNLSSNIGKIKEKWNKYNYCSDFTAFSDSLVPLEASCVARNIYTCSFCKRLFKSAQALGGHMNVHRRERAKLRLLPLSNISSHDHHSCSSLPANQYNPNFASSLSSPTYSFSTQLVFPRPHSSAKSPSDHLALATDHKDKKKLIVFDDSDRGINVGSGSTDHQGMAKNVRTSNYGDNMRAGRVMDGSDLLGFPLKDHDYQSFKAIKTEKNLIRLDLEMALLNDSDAQDVDLELRLGYSF